MSAVPPCPDNPSEARRHVSTPQTTAGPRPRARAARHRDQLQGLAAGGRAAHADEQPGSGGRRGSGSAHRLRRRRQGGARLGVLRHHRAHSAPPQGRRDAARPERQARRRVRDPRDGAARAHRQRQPGRRLGQLGRVPPAGRARAHHVRADDRRLVDLHRHAGHPAGHLPDVRRRRAEALRQRPGRQAGPDRRPRRHGRRAAAGRHHGRRRRALRGGRPAPHPAAPRDRVRRRLRRLAGRGAQAGRGRHGGQEAALHRAARQRGGRLSRSWSAAASSPTWSPTRRRRTTRSTATSPTG